MKKWLVSLVTMLLILTSCASGDKKTLNVFSWGEYIDKEVITEFEKKFDVRVNYTTFGSNEAMYNKLMSGQKYDILVPSDYMIQRLIEEDLLQKIELSKIPNVQHLMKGTLNKHYDPNLEYSVPFFWGDVGIVYNANNVKTSDVESQGWNVLNNIAYKGKIFMYDSQRDSFMVALKALGYSMNTKDEAQLNAAYEWLIQNRETMSPVYLEDSIIDQTIKEEKDLAVMYSGDAAYVMGENENLRYFVPKEGTNVWQDAMVIPKNAQEVDLAHEWMNFMLDSEIAKKNTEYVGYRTVVQSVYDEMIGAGGTFEGNNAYMENSNAKHEEFEYNKELTQIISDLWTKVKGQ